MKNTLGDLNNHLFAQLERLSEEDLTVEELEKEIKKVDDKIAKNINSDLQELKKKHNKETENLNNVSSTASTCPTCKQPIKNENLRSHAASQVFLLFLRHTVAYTDFRADVIGFCGIRLQLPPDMCHIDPENAIVIGGIGSPDTADDVIIGQHPPRTAGN